jgi:hypothetical protein
MKTRGGLNSFVRPAMGAVVCGLLAACSRTPDRVRDLPELPADFAQNLEAAHTAPVLVTKPRAPATTTTPPSNTPLPLAPNKACTSIYDGYVTYPIAVCYPPFNVDNLGLATQAFKSSVDPALASKFYKLSSHPRVRLGRPWFCTVRGGPWYAHVEGAQICNANPNIRSFTAEILGAPESVVVLWSGALTDVPPPLNLSGISQTGEQCTCCSGVMCPDGSCKPNLNLCGVMPPAVK